MNFEQLKTQLKEVDTHIEVTHTNALDMTIINLSNVDLAFVDEKHEKNIAYTRHGHKAMTDMPEYKRKRIEQIFNEYVDTTLSERGVS